MVLIASENGKNASNCVVAKTFEETTEYLREMDFEELHIDCGIGDQVLNWLADRPERIPSVVRPVSEDAKCNKTLKQKIHVLMILKKRLNKE